MGKINNNLKLKKMMVLFLVMVLIMPVIPKQVSAESFTLIPNGLYYIQNFNLKVVDIQGGSQENGASAILWELNRSSASQIFYFQRTNFNQYIITSYNSGKSLEVRNSSMTNDADIAQWDNHYGACQRWILEPSNNKGRFYIKNVNSGLYMDVAGNGSSNGTNIQQFEGNRSNAQKFKLLSAESLNMVEDFYGSVSLDGIYRIKSALGKYVDIQGGSKENGASAWLWEKANVNNQLFYVKTFDDGKCLIKSINSNKALEVRNSSHNAGADVAQWDDGGIDCQRWYIVPSTNWDGSFVKIINVESTLCMDVAGGSKENGTNIQQYYNNETVSQLFKLEKVS